MIYIKTFLDSFEIVVATAARFAAFNHTVDEFFFVNLKTHHSVNGSIVFTKHHGQNLGLRNGAGKTIEDYTAFENRRVALEKVGKHFNHQFVGNEQTFGYKSVGNFAEMCAFTDVLAQKVAGRDMVKAVFFYDFFALGAFAATGGAEYNYVHVSLL